MDDILKKRGVKYEDVHGHVVLGAKESGVDGRGCTARIVVAVVDDRPVALVFPASRRVVLHRLQNLLGADEVRLAPCDEVERVFGERGAGTSRTSPDLRGISLIMDASLMSARALEIRSGGREGFVRLTLEDWLAAADPGLGFFTEPDPGPD
jgi:prolyl-tRNA editing enzyme YbaK/EbsC (Cys-tRNA(Pro) deacylase)